MNILFLLISFVFGSSVLASGVAIVTVIHPIPVTVTYDPVAGKIIPPSPVAEGGSMVEEEMMAANDNTMDQSDNKDSEGKVNAKATASIATRSKITSMRSSGLKSTTASTDATTDVNSAFRMSLPFAFGTFAAVILAAIVF